MTSRSPAAAALRRAIVRTARRMNTEGINRGTSGNVSARWRSGMLIIPSAMSYEAMLPAHVVALGLGGASRGRRGRTPSTEWRMHAGIYAARPDIQAIVHAHPLHATALACLRRGIPAFHYMVAVAGGADIRCSTYETFGTTALAEAAVAALTARRACLLANHGIVACGATPGEALDLAVEVEVLAAQYLAALSVGEPALLPPDEMARVQEAFVAYRRGA